MKFGNQDAKLILGDGLKYHSLAGTLVEVDYVTMDGIEYTYISDFKINESMLRQGLKIDVVCAFSDSRITGANQAMGKNQNNFFFLGATTNNVFYSGIGKTWQASTKTYDTNFHKHTLEVANNVGKYYIDDVVATNYGTIQYETPEFEGNFYLGKTWTPAGGNVFIFKGKIKSCTIYYKTHVLYDLVAAKNEVTGFYYFYDKVTGAALGSGETLFRDGGPITPNKIYLGETQVQ